MKRLMMVAVVLFPAACFVAGCGGSKVVPDKTEPAKVEADYAKEWTSRKMQPSGAAAPAAEQKTSPEAAPPAEEKKN